MRTQIGGKGAHVSPQQVCPLEHVSLAQGTEGVGCGGFMSRKDTCHWAPHSVTRAHEGSVKASLTIGDLL